MRRFFITILAFLGSVVAWSQIKAPYFTTEEMPDLVKCLPAPPAKGSPAFQLDVQRYKWGKQQRKDPARAEMACRDAVWTYEALLDELDDHFGMAVSEENTPAIWNVLERSLRTVDQIRVAPKAWFKRIRPFEYFKEKTLTGEDDELRGEGSYPSGHTIRSWLAAMLFSEVNPAVADYVYSRAWEYGNSRVIAGAHWQSDVDASRVAASIGFASLQTSPEFQDDMTAAREEFSRLSIGRDYFVKITEVVPDVILEIRYFSTYNFVGSRVDGYEAPTALLTRQAADSLKAVSDDVKAMGYRIKIYDAYRPQKAVSHFVRWAADRTDTLMKTAFYPDLDKSVLFEQEYIMEKSGHSRGSTVDLTLIDAVTGKDIDMGGTFDWFGPESHPDFCGNPDTGEYNGDNHKSPVARSITPEQFANRMVLREAMLRHGFKALDSEWWHFTLRDEPFPDTYFTFPVE
ncbi:MAG: phosphatase PAP2 family protein [Bacteroidales bacterium]|nr:phosphatase PAP2 family protein [Bacteroidales bacterium]